MDPGGQSPRLTTDHMFTHSLSKKIEHEIVHVLTEGFITHQDSLFASMDICKVMTGDIYFFRDFVH